MTIEMRNIARRGLKELCASQTIVRFPLFTVVQTIRTAIHRWDYTFFLDVHQEV
jgi:hypothetical protein